MSPTASSENKHDEVDCLVKAFNALPTVQKQQQA